METTKRFIYFLLPSVIGQGITFLTLPLTTAILDPKDYGIFALFAGFGGLISSFSILGFGYLWSAHFPSLKEEDRIGFVSTLMLVGVIATLISSCFFVLVWPVIRKICQLSADQFDLYLIVLFGSVLAHPWTHAVEYITLEKKAKSYFFLVVSGSLFSITTVLVCLYILDLRVISLFFGSLANNLVLFVGSVTLLREVLKLRLSKRWFLEILRRGSPTVPSNILEHFAIVIERNALSAMLSFSTLGIYTHSQSYRSFVSLGIKAVARAVWPVSLEEARDRSRTFPRTRSAWDILFFITTLGGFASAVFSKEFISVLTHGKFTNAAPLVTAWLLFVVFQNMGKEHVAVIYAANRGIFNAYLHSLASITHIVLVLALVPVLGVWGAVVSPMVSQMIYRFAILWKACRIQFVPFNDRQALVAATFMALLLALQLLAWEDLTLRLGGATFLLILYLSFNIRVLQKHLIPMFWGFLGKGHGIAGS